MNRVRTFPFWRKQYLFHPEATSNFTLLKIYHPYNPIAKINWWFWKKINLYQKLFTFHLSNDSKLYKIIERFIDSDPDYVWAINRGTESIYQKTTGLIISGKCSGKPNRAFFFKWGDSKLAIDSIKNEIAINNDIKQYPFAPKMLEFYSNENEAFYTTEIIHGSKYAYLTINAEIISLIKEIQILQPAVAINYCLSDALIQSFHHGDFCPWNLIQEDKTNIIKAIDWEFCGIYPKGFDLLYFIFSVEFQVKKNYAPQDIINEQYSLIQEYYSDLGIEDWMPYLKEFAEICSKRYINTKEGDNFLKLLACCR